MEGDICFRRPSMPGGPLYLELVRNNLAHHVRDHLKRYFYILHDHVPLLIAAGDLVSTRVTLER